MKSSPSPLSNFLTFVALLKIKKKKKNRAQTRYESEERLGCYIICSNENLKKKKNRSSEFIYFFFKTHFIFSFNFILLFLIQFIKIHFDEQNATCYNERKIFFLIQKKKNYILFIPFYVFQVPKKKKLFIVVSVEE